MCSGQVSGTYTTSYECESACLYECSECTDSSGQWYCYKSGNLPVGSGTVERSGEGAEAEKGAGAGAGAGEGAGAGTGNGGAREIVSGSEAGGGEGAGVGQYYDII